MPLYGLIGKKLSHSFSQRYFTEKFKKEGLTDHEFRLFELDSINEVAELKKEKDLRGFNITIPYKEEIIPFLTHMADSARKVGAVNVVKILGGEMYGHNSDYYGFKSSLEEWLPAHSGMKALVLGTGGASKAVSAALTDLSIPFRLVSRNKSSDVLTYKDLSPEVLSEHKLIVNTTPLGMAPNEKGFPDLDYNAFNSSFYLYDLVYNPDRTVFLKKGLENGAHIKNGLEMLYLQADKAWEIWEEKPAGQT